MESTQVSWGTICYILEDERVLLSSIASDTLCRPTRAMPRVLVEGERDSEVLADILLG